MRPRVPSMSCRSVTRLRSFSSGSRSSSPLPSTTTSTSNSLEGNRRVTSSYCLNSGVSERKSCPSESSTLMRSMPSAAMTQSAARTSATIQGKRSEIRPIRSRPSARRWCSPPGGSPMLRISMGRAAGRYRRLRLTATLENWLPGELIEID